MAEKTTTTTLPCKKFFCCYAHEVVNEMKGIVCDSRAKKYHSVSFVKHYLRNKTWLHQQRFFNLLRVYLTEF